MGIWSFRGVQQLRLGVDHPPSSGVKVKEMVGPYLYSSQRRSRDIYLPFQGNFNFPFCAPLVEV
jgi:hypothetical protein